MYSASNPFLHPTQKGLQKVKVLYLAIAMQSARIGNVKSNVCRKTTKMRKEGAPDF